MCANVNNLNRDHLLDPAIILGADDLLFQDDGDENLIEFFVEDERENHAKIQTYFEEIIPLYSMSDFQSHFRLTRRTFQKILDDIGPFLYPHNPGPARMCPGKQLCIAIWTFANQEVYRSIADRFGVSMNTAWRCMFNVAQVLNNQAHNYIRWPEGQQLIEAEEQFRAISGFPGVVATVDGCHIEVSAPHFDEGSYVNRKHFHSVILQGMSDANMKFVDVFAGIYGSVHDARVWQMSDIKQAINEDPEHFCPRESHIIGDSAYPIDYHLMPPFRDNGHLTQSQRHYNTMHSKTRVVIERLFALLKGRFRRLRYLYVQYIEYAPLIIIACCVLHNICLDLEGVVDEEIVDEFVDVGNDEIDNQYGRDVVAAVEKRFIIAALLFNARRVRINRLQQLRIRRNNVRRNDQGLDNRRQVLRNHARRRH